MLINLSIWANLFVFFTLLYSPTSSLSSVPKTSSTQSASRTGYSEGRRLNDANETETTRIYFLKKCGGAGCPYTASWFSHVNLYRRLTWWIDITKMEAASFNIFDKAKLKFQLSDPDSFFVHHMSMYEHLQHKKYGFEVAHNKTLIMSRAAVAGECDNLEVQNVQNVIALIPFYGGLPPNVTKDLSVKSIGQGNSLVDASTKVLQTMASLCSCLRYYGHAVIGVVRHEDKALVLETLKKMPPIIAERTNVVQFKMHKPAHLPFYLLAWGQLYTKHRNCHKFYMESDAVPDLSLGFNPLPIDLKKLPNQEEFQICTPNAVPKYKGGPIQVIYMLKNVSIIKENELPLKFIYYTECDQIVRYDSLETYQALSSASNESTFFVGRRKEKDRESEPSDYMGGLNQWRECGVPGYSLDWPKSHFVHAEAK